MSQLHTHENILSTKNEDVNPIETEVLATQEPMTEQEKALFQKLSKTVIDGGVQAIKASHALKEIKEKRLFRETHETWDAFCSEVFDITVQRASQLIAAAELEQKLLEDFPPEQVPKSERALRELAKVKDSLRESVLKYAHTQAVIAGGPITGALIQDAHLHFNPKAASSGKIAAKPIDPMAAADEVVKFVTGVDFENIPLKKLKKLRRVSQILNERISELEKELQEIETMVAVA